MIDQQPWQTVSLVVKLGCFGVAAILLLLAVRWIRVDPAKCGRCGYSLKGLPIGRCPECGVEGSDTHGRRRRRAFAAGGLAAFLALIAPWFSIANIARLHVAALMLAGSDPAALQTASRAHCVAVLWPFERRWLFEGTASLLQRQGFGLNSQNAWTYNVMIVDATRSDGLEIEAMLWRFAEEGKDRDLRKLCRDGLFMTDDYHVLKRRWRRCIASNDDRLMGIESLVLMAFHVRKRNIPLSDLFEVSEGDQFSDTSRANAAELVRQVFRVDGFEWRPSEIEQLRLALASAEQSPNLEVRRMSYEMRDALLRIEKQRVPAKRPE